MDLLQIAQQFGFPALIVILLLLDRQRIEKKRQEEYDRLTARLSKVEDEQRGALCTLLVETSNTLDRATRIIERHEDCCNLNEGGPP